MASAPACGRRAKPGSHAGLPPGVCLSRRRSRHGVCSGLRSPGRARLPRRALPGLGCCMRCVTQREDGSRTRSVRLSCLSDATAVVFTRFGPDDWLPFAPSQPTWRLLRLAVAGRSPAPTPGCRPARCAACVECCTRRVPQREDGSRTRSVRLSCLSDATAVVFTRFGPEDPLPLTPSQLRERRKLAEREAILPQRRDCCRLHAIWARRPAAFHAVAADRGFSPRPAALSAPRGRGPLRGCVATVRVADPSSGPPSRRRWPPHTGPAGPGRRRG